MTDEPPKPRASRHASLLPRLQIENFAHLDKVDLQFGDLTVLVGPQGAGKSLALQWLKVALDGRQIVRTLEEAGSATGSTKDLTDLIFGSGMGSAWTPDTTRVLLDGRKITPRGPFRSPVDFERAFFIPAHRTMLISDGWAQPFQRLSNETPVVARIFSHNLFTRFSRTNEGPLFPQDRVLKKLYRDEIDRAIFHGGQVRIEQFELARRLRLVHGETKLPFMTWTAGQREFTPLLLGLYNMLPERKASKHSEIEWVIIEEPEMGLHPDAISVVLLLVLELLWRGYRVVLSTHSPHVMSMIWMMNELKNNHARWQLVCEAFGVKAGADMRPVAESAMERSYRAYLMRFEDNGHVCSKDISTLDPSDDDDDIAEWGGLTGLVSRFGAAVRRSVNEAER